MAAVPQAAADPAGASVQRLFSNFLEEYRDSGSPDEEPVYVTYLGQMKAAERTTLYVEFAHLLECAPLAALLWGLLGRSCGPGRLAAGLVLCVARLGRRRGWGARRRLSRQSCPLKLSPRPAAGSTTRSRTRPWRRSSTASSPSCARLCRRGGGRWWELV